jgi:hypothetical protein
MIKFSPAFRTGQSDNLGHTLERYGLVINTTHKILICVECRRCIDPKSCRQHIMKHHREIKPPIDLDSQLRTGNPNVFPDLQYPPVHPEAPVDPIFGLEPPTPKYQLCTGCKGAFKGQESDPPSQSFANHRCNTPHPTYTLTSVQRFGVGTIYKWFPVHSNTETQLRDGMWASYRELMNRRQDLCKEPSFTENYRILHQFLQKERWLDHVHGKDTTKLIDLITLSPHDPLIPYLSRHIHAFLAHKQSRLRGHYLRRLLSTRPS